VRQAQRRSTINAVPLNPVRESALATIDPINSA
jgi:hypothetical protein